MSLQNLVGISLDVVVPDRRHIQRLLAAVRRNLADAQIDGLSNENRFDVAYKAIMQLSMLVLHACGYRTLTSRTGHHRTAIQALQVAMGLPVERLIVLDALRKQRNAADYSGDTLSPGLVFERIEAGTALLVDVIRWLQAEKVELLS